MQMLKALVGGIIGGGIGILIVNQIQAGEDSNPWFLLIVGLLAGLGARILAGADRSFVTGLMGALTAIAVTLGSTYWASMSDFQAAAEKFESAASPTEGAGNNSVVTGAPAQGGPTMADTEAVDSDNESGGGDAGDSENTDDNATDNESDSEEATEDESEEAADTDNSADPASNTDADSADEADAASKSDETDAVDDQASDDPAPEPVSQSPESVLPPDATTKAQVGTSPIEYLVHALSSLLAFALATGSGAKDE